MINKNSLEGSDFCHANSGALVMGILSRVGEYVDLARRVRTEHGVSLIRQSVQIAGLLGSPGRIGPGDYYVYRLFEKSLTQAEKREFVGWKGEPRLDGLNRSSWRCLGLDKVLVSSLLQSNRICTPETRAIYLAGQRRPLAGATSLKTREELLSWLRHPENYPFFSKPSASGFGSGAIWAVRYDAGLDQIVVRDGSGIPVENIEREFMDVERLGYLFQTPILPDRRLISSLGNTVTSLRMMVLVDEHEGPLLHRAFWKFPTGHNTHDNYNGGITGNLAAAIDLLSGRVTRVINGTGLGLVDVTSHPDTGVAFNTLAVPDWQQVVDFTLEAAIVFPKLSFQQWDIALSNEGPMALEVNLFGTGGCDLTQLLYRKGLCDATMQRFLSRHAH